MIQLQAQRFVGFGDVAVIDEPAGLRVDFAAHRHFADERVSVQPRALVPRRHIRQAVR